MTCSPIEISCVLCVTGYFCEPYCKCFKLHVRFRKEIGFCLVFLFALGFGMLLSPSIINIKMIAIRQEITLESKRTCWEIEFLSRTSWHISNNRLSLVSRVFSFIYVILNIWVKSEKFSRLSQYVQCRQSQILNADSHPKVHLQVSS